MVCYHKKKLLAFFLRDEDTANMITNQKEGCQTQRSIKEFCHEVGKTVHMAEERGFEHEGYDNMQIC